jgi:glyceraldehyde 3-phosphate dehydrogenase
MTKVALNGFGRVGRAFLKLALRRPELSVAAINDVAEPANLAYLLRFDSVYGRYEPEVSLEEAAGQMRLRIGAVGIPLLREADPAQLPWKELGVDVVVEATGKLASYAKAAAHLTAGARNVILTAPAKDDDRADARTVLIGVNEEGMAACKLTSNGSCTTNSASPVLQILSQGLGVKKAFLNTVHGYTATQSLVDGPARGSDLRRGRAAASNIIPSSTGAALAVTRAIQGLRGKFDGIALRVPVLNGSLSCIVFVASKSTSADEINTLLERAENEGRWKGVFKTTRDPIVSSDIVGDTCAAIADLSLTKVVDGDLCAVYSWYDNEMGYANTLVERVIRIAPHA